MISPIHPQSPTDVAHHYDTLDHFYRDTWGRHLHHGYWERGDETPEAACSHLTHTVADNLDLPGIDADIPSILDIGCGYGETGWHLAEIHRAFVTGYTLSEVQKREAEDRTPSTPDTVVPDFRLGDFLENDLPADAFDAALSIECVSHIEDKKKFFEEIHRVLKPGARLVLCAWLAKDDATPSQRRHLLEPICRDGRLPGLATMAEYRDLLHHAGLHLIEAGDIGPRVARTWTTIFWRLVAKVFTDFHYTKFLFTSLASGRPFALTIPRLILAYHLHALGYLLLVAEKPTNERT